MKKKYISLVIIILNSSYLLAQHTTIHQEELQQYVKMNFLSESAWDSLEINKFNTKKKQHRAGCKLTKKVFGWNPYWKGTAYEDYDYNLLSDISYFSYQVDAETGSYRDIHYWKTTNMVNLAQAAGTRVCLTATLFSDHNTFFGSEKAQQTLIDSLISLVKLRNASGVDIDFESMSSHHKAPFADFMQALSQAFHTQIPGSQVSVALPAIDWSGDFDIPRLVQYVDLFVIMGYGYHWSGSSVAGPVSPKNNGAFWNPYSTTRSVLTYLEKGIPKEKLCLGIPYYGRDWPTTTPHLGAETTAVGDAVVFSAAKQKMQTYRKKWDIHSSTPWYAYQEGEKWRQCWFDNAESLAAKYDMVKALDIAGIGIWALGYDEGTTDLWQVIEEKFSDCGNNYCSGSFSDLGGPTGEYFNDEDYIFTISPTEADSVTMVFSDFFVEKDYDTLFIYDGPDTKSALLGSYTGLDNPGTVTGHSGALTFRFKSDRATTTSGWNAYWSCNGQQAISSPEIVKQEDYLHVFPNPFSNNININVKPAVQNILIQIFNIKGLLIYEDQLSDANPQIQLSHLVPGIYFVIVQSEKINQSIKIIKK